MKKLILILAIFSVQVLHAENWLNQSKIKSGSKEAYSLKAECERISNEQCYDLGVNPSSIYSEIDQEVDDRSKPVYSKSEVQTCSSNSNCDSIFTAKTCTNNLETKIKNYLLKEVYCSRFLSFEKKTIKVMAVDSAKALEYEEQKTLKATLQAKEAAISYAQKLMACGNKVVAYMLVRNQPKALTTAQVDTMVQTFAPIKSLLETGSLTTAKEKIALVVADGVVVTEADKTALIAEIDLCK
jgi:hypothetical protein